MLKYDVGQVVYVKNYEDFLEDIKEENVIKGDKDSFSVEKNFSFTRQMNKFCGKLFIIKYKCEDHYILENDCFMFQDWMLKDYYRHKKSEEVLKKWC